MISSLGGRSLCGWPGPGLAKAFCRDRRATHRDGNPDSHGEFLSERDPLTNAGDPRRCWRQWRLRAAPAAVAEARGSAVALRP